MRSAGLSRAEFSDDRGFTLLEVLVSLAIFAMIVVGAVGVLGASNGGGLFEGFPTGFASARTARDITAASVYLNAFEEFVASKGSAYATPDNIYCVGTGCSPEVPLPSGLSGYPTPPGEGYQLNWTKLEVLIQKWAWDTNGFKSTNPQKILPECDTLSTTSAATETLTRVCARLTWQIQGRARSVTVDRFIR